MKGYWEICLEIWLVERPGHDVKWPLLMAVMKLDLTAPVGCSMNVLGKFAIGDVMADNAVCLVWMGAC